MEINFHSLFHACTSMSSFQLPCSSNFGLSQNSYESENVLILDNYYPHSFCMTLLSTKLIARKPSVPDSAHSLLLANLYV